MLNADEFIDKVAFVLGIIGRALVFVGMACGCVLLWYFVLQMIK